jgi:hypothetical protein
MTTPKDETRAPRRQPPFAYSPTVREPLPKEFEDLVFQLMAFVKRKRGSDAKPTDDSQPVRAPLAPDALFVERSAKRLPYQRRER